MFLPTTATTTAANARRKLGSADRGYSGEAYECWRAIFPAGEKESEGGDRGHDLGIPASFGGTKTVPGAGTDTGVHLKNRVCLLFMSRKGFDANLWKIERTKDKLLKIQRKRNTRG